LSDCRESTTAAPSCQVLITVAEEVPMIVSHMRVVNIPSSLVGVVELHVEPRSMIAIDGSTLIFATIVDIRFKWGCRTWSCLIAG
jgi:hypothetical protein